jgi:hypothetical protein
MSRTAGEIQSLMRNSNGSLTRVNGFASRDWDRPIDILCSTPPRMMMQLLREETPHAEALQLPLTPPKRG